MVKSKLSDSVDLLLSAWDTLAPDATFSGMTRAQFIAACDSFLTTRARISAIDLERKAKLATRATADGQANALYLSVVNSIKGSLEHGEDSDLYRALGYKTKSERKSGLTQKKQNQPGATGVN